MEDRKNLTFRQAEGIDPLPSVLALRTVPPTFRQKFAMLVEEIISKRYDYHRNGVPHKDIFYLIWTDFFGQYPGAFPNTMAGMNSYLEHWLKSANDVDVLELVQKFCRQSLDLRELSYISNLLDYDRVAYFLEYESDPERPTLMPRITDDQADNLKSDLSTISGQRAALAHLHKAAERIQAAEFKSSVRESISAVESIARVLSGSPGATLGDALKKMARGGGIHKALEGSFLKLYGWTSDEHGIRHASIDPAEDVSENLAIFMLSSCASFCAYLQRNT